MRLAFVVPRYGQGVLGGAEMAARQFAERLNARGHDVTVLTTCARDLQTWRNEMAPGEETLNGVHVRRFPVAWTRPKARRHRALTHHIAIGRPTSLDDERAWVDSGPHSPFLYGHLLRFGHTYDLLMFVPYPFSFVYYATTVCPERTVVWPCLHNEPFARLQETRSMLESSVGLMYNCDPEKAFAERALGVRHPGGRVVGIGVTSGVGDAARFRRTYGIDAPFVLSVGRLDPMKNLLELLSAFLAYKGHRTDPLKLVLIGEGPLVLPSHPDIVKVGFVPEADKWDAYAAATVLCQPSLVESFSLTLMEAWLQGTPVLVHGGCDVTQYHVQRSQGGLSFLDSHEFGAVLDWLLTHPATRQRMGILGQQYVRTWYHWDRILQTFEGAAEDWILHRRSQG